jgi:hypothetical protein
MSAPRALSEAAGRRNTSTMATNRFPQGPVPAILGLVSGETARIFTEAIQGSVVHVSRHHSNSVWDRWSHRRFAKISQGTVPVSQICIFAPIHEANPRRRSLRCCKERHSPAYRSINAIVVAQSGLPLPTIPETKAAIEGPNREALLFEITHSRPAGTRSWQRPMSPLMVCRTYA